MAELLGPSDIGESQPGMRRLVLLRNGGTAPHNIGPHIVTESRAHRLSTLEERARQRERPLVIDSMALGDRDLPPLEGSFSTDVPPVPGNGTGA